MELGSDFFFQLRLRFETGDIALKEDLQNCLDGLYEIGQLVSMNDFNSGKDCDWQKDQNKTLGEACPYLSVFKLMGIKRNNRIRTGENSILNYQLSSKPTVSYKPFTVYFNVICHIHFIGAKPTSVTFCVQNKIRPSFCRSICHNSGCNGVFL